MESREKTRPSLGLERLELEDGQGQGGGWEQESRRVTRLTAWTFVLFFELLFCCIFLFGMETTWYGDSYFDESWNFNFYMVSSCSILFTDFGTVFVFALG